MADPQEEVSIELDPTLQYTQGLRRSLVDTIYQGEPTNLIHNSDIVLKALKDMDSAAIGRARIQVEDDKVKSDREINNTLTELVMNLPDRGDPFERADAKVPAPEVSPEELGEHELVPGEDAIGIIDQSGKDFEERITRTPTFDDDEE